MKASTVASFATIGSLMTGADKSGKTDSEIVINWPEGSVFVTSEARDESARNVDIEGPGKKVFTIQPGATSLDPIHVAGSWKEDSDGRKTRPLMICDLTITPSASEHGAGTFEFLVDPDAKSIYADDSEDVSIKCHQAIEDGGKSESKMGSEEAGPDHGEL